nr:proline-rich proteoglycan 2-like [Aegilops tauschii subsp. strangulata]
MSAATVRPIRRRVSQRLPHRVASRGPPGPRQGPPGPIRPRSRPSSSRSPVPRGAPHHRASPPTPPPRRGCPAHLAAGRRRPRLAGARAGQIWSSGTSSTPFPIQTMHPSRTSPSRKPEIQFSREV